MFEQHPVPQNISSYQFRLVGDMTLKQFFQLAGGGVVAVIMYSLPLPAIFRWPLVALAAIGGAAFAFLPIQNRPLEVWIVAFLQSIYSPTIYFWSDKHQNIDYFQPEGAQNPAPTPQVPTQDTQQKSAQEPFVENLDSSEKNYLDNISNMIQTHKETPLADVAVPTTPLPQTNQQPQPAVSQPKPQMEVPKVQAVEVKPKGFEEKQIQEQKPITQTQVEPTLSAQPVAQTQQAVFSPEAAPPLPPEKPNIIVGQVYDSKGKIIDGAILEIKDKMGHPVRALKSNKVGHFQIVTPLPDGEYTIVTEKDGFTFMPLTISVYGTIIQPIAIKSKQ